MAHAPLTLAAVFADAAPVVKLSMLLLAAAAVAALAVLARALASRAGAGARSLDVLGGIVAVGPLLGLFAGAYGLLNMCIGLANVGQTPAMSVLAPGFAEAVASVGLGLFAATLAAAARAVLKLRGGDGPAARLDHSAATQNA